MNPYILISGSPVDGLTFEGPYATHEEATRAGDAGDDDWWVTELLPPEQR